jgi:hypothetical protein
LNKDIPYNVLNKFYIGSHANRIDLPSEFWCPDFQTTLNPHLLMSATSGSGKTTLLKEIAKYLYYAKKHIFIFDLKGDMIINNDNGERIGNYIEFTAWNSEYGINPFEFDTGVKEEFLKEIVEDDSKIDKETRFKLQNSGPKVQVERLIEIIRKNFLPNMGTIQKDILMYLFSDTYRMKGIIYNEIDTWLNELPSLEDTLLLIQQIKVHFGRAIPTRFNFDDSLDYLAEVDKILFEIKTKEIKLTNNEESDKEELEKDIESLNTKLTEIHKSYCNTTKSSLEEHHIKRLDLNKWFTNNHIDIQKYATKESLRTMDKMASYISALISAGTFHSKRPPVKSGLNIINLSGLEVGIQRFIVDIWLGKVFKACKIRGEYEKLKDKTRGEKCDTFFIIDESKLIAGNTREKNDPYSYLNRIATESRGFGLGMIVAAQSAEHFPPEFLKNFDMQIVLNTGIADYETVRKAFGLDKQTLDFVQAGRGKALIKKGKQFIKINVFTPEERKAYLENNAA